VNGYHFPRCQVPVHLLANLEKLIELWIWDAVFVEFDVCDVAMSDNPGGLTQLVRAILDQIARLVIPPPLKAGHGT
jgi:hypothetical protein